MENKKIKCCSLQSYQNPQINQKLYNTYGQETIKHGGKELKKK